MKKAELSKDEKDVLRSFGHGEWQSVEDLETEKKKAVEAARATLHKKTE
jgi:hypothetical protein